jgi:hypothetical protein
MKVRFHVVGVTVDRRGPRELEAARALEQARIDKALQERFEEGVRRNEARRYFAAQPDTSTFLLRQAD